MKSRNKTKKIWFVFACVLFCFNVQLQAQDKEEEKIIKTLNDEFNGFVEKDKDKWMSAWKHTEYVKFIAASAGFYDEISGWDSLNATMNYHFDSPGPIGFKVERSNFDIRVNNNIAIVHCTETLIPPNGWSGFYADTIKVHSAIILEKENEEWKNIEVHNFFKSTYENNDINIEANLDTQGHYLLLKDKVKEAIKVFTLNAELFPTAWNTWNSLAEAYMNFGDKDSAMGCYQKSLELNPENENAKKHLAEIKK